MEKYKVTAHAKSNLKAHIIWTPKYRKKLIQGQIAIRIRDIIRQTATNYDIEILGGKVAPDYVHVFVRYKPHMSISQIAKYLKGVSAHKILDEFNHLKLTFPGGHFWARGYMAISSGDKKNEALCPIYTSTKH